MDQPKLIVWTRFALTIRQIVLYLLIEQGVRRLIVKKLRIAGANRTDELFYWRLLSIFQVLLW